MLTPPHAELRFWSADELADVAGRPRPTSEQRAVIEAPLAPALVVAGAGSGKTETMANRVLWLLANRMVAPQGILGLTFTRRAAGELAHRIRDRISDLTRLGVIPPVSGDALFDAPTVCTYNAYANGLYRDGAEAIGAEVDSPVLGEAAAWQLARTTVMQSSAEGLVDLAKNLDVVTAAVLSLSRAMAENLVEQHRVREFAREFRALGSLPPGGKGAYEDAAKLAESVGGLDVLVEVVGEYERAKAARGLVDYSDQVGLAMRVLTERPATLEAERLRFPLVVLDEYQDTSVAQARLLARLFHGRAVMAVGDPNQAIYGWRGASCGNLADFAREFGADTRYDLSTSWRNGRRILTTANALIGAGAGAGAGVGAGVPAATELRPSPTATDFVVQVEFEESVVDEAETVACWVSEHLAVSGGTRATDAPPSAAILLRTRTSQRFFLEALRRHAIPYHVLGIGGLLAEPEVADIVCVLSVLHDPSASMELLRLLAGSRWRIGVADLHALSRIASSLRDRDYRQHALADDVRAALRQSGSESAGGSLVDALDFVATARAEHSLLSAFSATGLERMRAAGSTFARLRARSALDLPDLIALVVHEFNLDIEVDANPHRPLGIATIDALYHALDNYLAVHDVARLGGFLSWLRQAEMLEDLSPRAEDPEPGTVQVLTIHGSKGLEWDIVAVPRLVEGELPGRPREGHQGWLAFGQLPWPFRGDAADLPHLAWRAATTRKELLRARDQFKTGVRERSDAEERRLAYVAITRARHRLLLTGSFWSSGVTVRTPSRFLVELAGAGVIPSVPECSIHEANPLGDQLEMLVWPRDPLGSRRPVVEAGALAVRTATPVVLGPWQEELRMLLAERRERRLGALPAVAPVRIPASRFADHLSRPAQVSTALQRPMPQPPHRSAQLGTRFHSWVEERFGDGGSTAPFDDDMIPGHAALQGIAETRLAALQTTFEASPWAGQRPVEVEREIHFPFEGAIIVCKIDAVFELLPRTGTGDATRRFEIVDWKTGRLPTAGAQLEEKQLQLALYRLAYAAWRGIQPECVDAVFYFVAENRVVRPRFLPDEAELVARWRQRGSASG